ncbi:MAG: SDR family oxidoreductase [Bacteroidales bacterium]|nr:SDR family oxidoreductase [Bacteroidales bacterium]
MNIIITGASRGIGFEIVKAFCRGGDHTIIAISRNLSYLKKLMEECKGMKTGAKVIPLEFDLNYQEYRSHLLPDILKVFNEVDILINNAGKLFNKPFEEFSDLEYNEIFDTNVKSAFRMIQMLLPHFVKNAHIVNISSMGGYQGSQKFSGLSLYSASKAAVAVLSEALAEEFKDRDIAVNCLALGAVNTEMLEEAFPGLQSDLDAESIANYIQYFAMEGNKYFNGKILPVAKTTL